MNKPEYHNREVYPLPKEQGRPKPKIPIRLSNFFNGESQIISALIDTGSDYCVFPDYITESIGFELSEKTRKKEGLKGISGTPVETYVHGFKIELLDARKEKVLCYLETHAYTVKTKNLSPILGMHGFLKNFKISIDYKKDIIIIEW